LSTLGKVLTVLTVLAAIALMVLVAMESRLSKNWHEMYDKCAAAATKALGQEQSALQQCSQAKAALSADQQTWMTEKAALEDKVRGRDGQITKLEGDKAEQAKNLATLGAQYTDLKASLDKLIADKGSLDVKLAATKKDADELLTLYTEQSSKLQVALAQLSSLKETLRQTAEEKEALESKIQAIVQSNPGLKLPEEVAALPTHTVNGRVTMVDNESKVAEVDIGSDDGVVAGMKLYVYDAKACKYLATLTVSKVEHDSAAGDLSVVEGAVEKDCHVTNRFE